MRERDEGVVVHLGARPAVVELAVDALDRPEQHQRLVHEVRSEVEEHSPALRVAAALAPARRVHRRAEALEARLEPDHLPERALAHQLLHREEVTVEAAVEEPAPEPVPTSPQA